MSAEAFAQYSVLEDHDCAGTLLGSGEMTMFLQDTFRVMCSHLCVDNRHQSNRIHERTEREVHMCVCVGGGGGEGCSAVAIACWYIAVATDTRE